MRDSRVADDVDEGGVIWCAGPGEAAPPPNTRCNRDDVFVFVHGSGVDPFQNASLRPVWVHSGGSVRDRTPCFVAFLWRKGPASVLAYAEDRQLIPAAARALATFLTELVQRSAAARVRVAAHSLGVQVALEAGWLLEPSVMRRIDEVLFLQGDVQEDTFMVLVPRWARYARAVTVLGNSGDTVLRLAQAAHGTGRLGQFTPRFRRRIRAAGCLGNRIAFLDASRLDGLPGYGHGYWGSVAIVDRILWGLGARPRGDDCFEPLVQRRRPPWSPAHGSSKRALHSEPSMRCAADAKAMRCTH
jgi:esterase/lipase superfamily enzyme